MLFLCKKKKNNKEKEEKLMFVISKENVKRVSRIKKGENPKYLAKSILNNY